jgi:phosphoglycolate phosphatase
MTCNSLERTRALWLHIEKLGVRKGWRVLHLAPERGVYDRFSQILAPEDYVVADFDPTGYPFAKNCVQIDLTRMEGWPSDHFDLIVHSHVIEHIPATLAYPIFHLHRMLKPAGTHLCVIPFIPGIYDECYGAIGAKERLRRFGQNDHVRKLGSDDVGAHLGSILTLPENPDMLQHFDADTLRAANIPEENWSGYHIGTVLQLRKHDYKLSF